jgi:hypothetical protein
MQQFKIIPIVAMTKNQGATVCGSLSVTSKMPCKSYSLPTEACITGYAMSNVHTVTPIGNSCVAPKQGGECKDCRACWSNDTVSYAMH